MTVIQLKKALKEIGGRHRISVSLGRVDVLSSRPTDVADLLSHTLPVSVHWDVMRLRWWQCWFPRLQYRELKN